METYNKRVFMWSNCLLFAIVISLTLVASNPVVYHEFVVQEKTVTRLCKTKSIITVNGEFPGPALEARNGDTVVIKATNKARYNVTLHWHGIRQMRTAWADGPEYVTQCPIRPGETYTYRFTIEDQEGTLWWHAHSKWIRATVYGAIIIKPKLGSAYPFPTPKLEFPIILGEWWNRDVQSVMSQAVFSGAAPNVSNAFTINGQPGDLYRCPSTTKLTVSNGDRVLLRVINAALNQQLFFTVANHKLTIVAADAVYTKQFTSSVILLGPGQTTDVLLTADKTPGRYYMAASAYESSMNAAFDNTTTTAILQYKSTSCTAKNGACPKPTLPQLPVYNDTNTVTTFLRQLRSPAKAEVPTKIDESLFFTVGLGQFKCRRGPRCQGPNSTRFAASMNNVSFVLPNTTSLLQAYYQKIPGVYTTDFPPVPPVQFDYTGNVSRALWQPVLGTKLYKLKYGSSVQIVLQDTSIVTTENHPIHLHGYHFYIVGEGFGNFNAARDTASFNLYDPPQRNTINVPVGGWSVIRFVADNPGVWLFHCHIDSHLTWGFAMSFVVENGVGEAQSLQPPPADFPRC